MSIWAIADLHLSLGTPQKTMEVFGPPWKNYQKKIEANWKSKVKQNDLVLIPGDISWASNIEEAYKDLEFIDHLPGTKLLLKGNHDYWWPSHKKMKELLPPSIHFIGNDAFYWNGVAIGGTRLWDTSEYNFDQIVTIVENPYVKKKTEAQIQEEKLLAKKIFEKELNRLKLSLSCMDSKAKFRIAMTHYPPISSDLKDSRTSKILDEYQIDICVFGHLHNVKKGVSIFGKKNECLYALVSADYLNFEPLLLTEL